MTPGSLTESLRETLAVFDEAGEPRGTNEVAERLELGRRSTYDRLDRLVDRGYLETKKIGASARVWWRPRDPSPTSSPTSSETNPKPGELDQQADVDEPGGAVEPLDDPDRTVIETGPGGDYDGSLSLPEDEYALFTIDRDGRVRTWSGSATRLTGYDRGEVLGEHVSIFYTEEDREAGVPDENLADATDRGAIECTGWRRRADGTTFRAHVTVAAIHDEDGHLRGYANVIREVSEPGERGDERRARRDGVFERLDDAVYALDDQFRFVYVNDTAEEVLGHDSSELVGEKIWERFPEATDTIAREEYRRSLASQESTTFEVFYDPCEAWFEVSVYPSETGLTVYFRDVTERKERERALEESERRYRAIAENFPNGVVAVLDDDLRFTIVEGRGFENLDYDASDLVGKRIQEVYPEEALSVIEPHYCSALRGNPNSFEIEVQGRTFEVRALPVTGDEEDVFAIMAMTQDVTERKERERALEESQRRYRALVEHFPNGIVALFDENLEYTLAAGKPLTDFGLDPDDLVGMDVGGVLPESDTSERVRNRCLSVLDGEVHEFGFEFEDRFFDAWAVPVTDESGAVFAGMIMTQDVTPRIERERELEHQREQLTAVNNLHDIVQDVTDAVIEQSTRTEIEEIVCERLAESDSYLFAWFSEVDPKTRSVEPKVEAGVDGYLEEISLSTNPDEPTGRGPTGRAIQTQEIQVVQNVFENRDFQPWREAAEKYGFQSSAAIPVTYEGTTYGVLGLYADRADAFTDAERSVISQIGEVVGHAIAALERKRVLMSDEVLELEVRVNDVSEAFGISADVDGTVDIDQVVPIDDGTFLEYGTATGNGMAAIEAAVASDRLPQWESVSVLESTNDETRFEIRFSKAPVLSTVAAHGGDFRQARLQDGDFYMRVHLPPSADVRQIVDSVVEIYPNMEMVSQRHLTRDRRSSQLRGALFEGLTDRQQTAIEAAYHAGFFEWPRNKTGEEVAASMGVSPPTFHQHVRKGLRKLLETAIETA